MNIYIGIPSGSFCEENSIARQLVNSLSEFPCNVTEYQTKEHVQLLNKPKIVPSAIHAVSVSKTGIACQRLAAKLDIPLIVTCTGMDIYADLDNPALRDQLLYVLESADKIIVPYNQMKKFLIARTHIRNGFVTVSPGVQEDEQPALSREEYGFSQDDQIILVDGGLLPSKNLLFVIKQLENLKNDFPRLKLVLFEKPFDKDYRNHIKNEASNKSWVNIMPCASFESPIYKLADIIVNASHVEGYNPLLLRAMRAGKIVVASGIDGNRAYINCEETTPGKGNGFVYPTSPAPDGFEKLHDTDDFLSRIVSILKDIEKYEPVGKRAELSVKKNYSKEKELYLHLGLYRDVTSMK